MESQHLDVLRVCTVFAFFCDRPLVGLVWPSGDVCELQMLFVACCVSDWLSASASNGFFDFDVSLGLLNSLPALNNGLIAWKMTNADRRRTDVNFLRNFLLE